MFLYSCIFLRHAVHRCPPLPGRHQTAMLDSTRVLLLLLALCCCSTHALTPGGVVVRRSVQSEWPAGCAWIDITAQLSQALPPLPTALCHSMPHRARTKDQQTPGRRLLLTRVSLALDSASTLDLLRAGGRRPVGRSRRRRQVAVQP